MMFRWLNDCDIIALGDPQHARGDPKTRGPAADHNKLVMDSAAHDHIPPDESS